MMETGNQWELSKENIQPLKQGRNIEVLNATLKGDKMSEEEIQKREAKRREFEGDLRIYSGDDPLGLWYKYILWIEQNYPEGGQEANLITVLEACIKEFAEDVKCKQDKRLLDIFLKYLRHINDPLEILNFMYEEGVCTNLAQFYISWSWYLENICNNQKADEVLLFGIEANAEPKEDLENARHQLQFRVAKSIAKGGMDNKDDEEDEAKRQPLGALKGKVKKSGKVLAPITRTGDVLEPNPGGLKAKGVSAKKNAPPQIYVDENDANCLRKESVPVAIPLQSTADHENSVKPGKWTENKLKKQTKSHASVKLDFQIHEDEQTDDLPLPVHLPPEANALRVRRRRSKSPPCARDKLAPNQHFFCDMKKLYSGGTEYQFEEIRGRKMMAAKQKEEEKRKAEEMQQQLELQVQKSKKLETEVEMLKRLVVQLPKENEDSVPQANEKQDSELNVAKQMEEEKRKAEEMQQKLDMQVQKSKNLESQVEMLKQMVEQLMQQKMEPAVAKPLQNQSKNDGSVNSTSSDSKIEKNHHRTSEASSIVRDLWNGTLEKTNCGEVSKTEIYSRPSTQRNSNFVIFRDQSNITETQPLQIVKEEAEKFSIYKDPSAIIDEKSVGVTSPITSSTPVCKNPLKEVTCSPQLVPLSITNVPINVAPAQKDLLTGSSVLQVTHNTLTGKKNTDDQDFIIFTDSAVLPDAPGKDLAKENAGKELLADNFKAPAAPTSNSIYVRNQTGINESMTDDKDTYFGNLSVNPISGCRFRMSVEAYTLPIPQSELEFLDAVSSTPRKEARPQVELDQLYQPEQKAANNVQEASAEKVPPTTTTAGKLSPINETSREYKSSSSSSSSGAYSSGAYSCFSRRQKLLGHSSTAKK